MQNVASMDQECHSNAHWTLDFRLSQIIAWTHKLFTELAFILSALGLVVFSLINSTKFSSNITFLNNLKLINRMKYCIGRL